MNRWKKLEGPIMERLGGKATPASGALWWSKADGSIGRNYRVEIKSTTKDRYRVTEKVMTKLNRDCRDSGGAPILIVNFTRHGRQVVVLRGLKHEQIKYRPLEPYDSGFSIIVGGIPWNVLSIDAAEAILQA